MKRFLLATLLCAIGHCAYGADTDGDGLLDVVPEPSAISFAQRLGFWAGRFGNGGTQQAYNTWRTNFGESTLDPSSPGDFNHDGAVAAAGYIVLRKSGGTQADYNVWRTHFGNQPAAARVPMRMPPSPSRRR